MNYIVNKEGKVMVKCDYQVNQEDIASRNEILAVSDLDIPLEEAVYEQGVIIRRQKVAQEAEESKLMRQEIEAHKAAMRDKLKIIEFTEEEIDILLR